MAVGGSGVGGTVIWSGGVSTEFGRSVGRGEARRKGGTVFWIKKGAILLW